MYAKKIIASILSGEILCNFFPFFQNYQTMILYFSIKKKNTHGMITVLSTEAYFGNYSREISSESSDITSSVLTSFIH